jgi:hypothetical protein
MTFCLYFYRLAHAHQDQISSVLHAAKGNITVALKIISLIEKPSLRVNVNLAGKLLEVPELAEALRGLSINGSDDGSAIQELQNITTAFAQRPQYNGQQWRAAYNNPKHLRASLGAYGEEHITLDPKAMRPASRKAFEQLTKAYGKSNLQVLTDAFFFGYADQPDGYLGVVAAWRSLMGQRPLSLDVVARLIHVVLNPQSPDITAHDFQHFVGGLYGTTAAYEGIGGAAGGINFYQDAQELDAVAAHRGTPLHEQKQFRAVVLNRSGRFLALGPHNLPSMENSSYFSAVFSAQTATLARAGNPVAVVNRLLLAVYDAGGLTHLNESEKQEVEALLGDQKRPDSLRSLLVSSNSFTTQEAFAAQLAKTLRKLDQIQTAATVRLLPETRDARLDLVARLLALELLLARHGYPLAKRLLSALSTETLWQNLREDFPTLQAVDFATEYPAIYKEVKREMALVMQDPQPDKSPQ